MSANQIINVIIRQVMRRLINTGIRKGVTMAGRNVRRDGPRDRRNEQVEHIHPETDTKDTR